MRGRATLLIPPLFKNRGFLSDYYEKTKATEFSVAFVYPKSDYSIGCGLRKRM